MKNLRVDKNNNYEIIVIGGGPSGVMAAVAASRNNRKVLLIEKNGYLGGALTEMGVGPMMTFHNRAGKQIIFGLAQEMVERLILKGGCSGHIKDSTGFCSTITPFDTEKIKTILEEMVLEAGADILYNTQLVDCCKENKNKLTTLIVTNISGISEYEASIFIDATGNADLAYRSGIEFIENVKQKTQPLTMNLRIPNVDREKLREYILNNQNDFDLCAFDVMQNAQRISAGGFITEWSEAKLKKEINIPRENVLFFETNNPSEFIINTSRIIDINPSDAWDLSKAEIIGRQQASEIFSFLKNHCPGFENCTQYYTNQVGIRDSRRILGQYVLTVEDIVSMRKFHDPVVFSAYSVDIHSSEGEGTKSIHLPDDGYFSIPLRCLIPDDFSNLIVVGRCISATYEAQSAMRTTPTVMAIGQAGGILASVAFVSECAISEVDYRKVKEKLQESNVIFDL